MCVSANISSDCLFVHLFIHPSIHASFHPSIHLPTFLKAGHASKLAVLKLAFFPFVVTETRISLCEDVL